MGMKTVPEVISFLEKHGYKAYPVSKIHSSFCVWSGSKRLPDGSPECNCNGYKVGWHVNVYSDSVVDYNNVEVEIFGERASQWFSLKSYSNRFEDVEKRFDEIEQSLLRAWKAV